MANDTEVEHNSEEHKKYYLSEIDKEIKRNYLAEKCIIAAWEKDIINKTVLELGGGPGYFGRYIKPLCKLINTDISFSFLKEAKQKYEIPCIASTALNLPFKDLTFDTIIISGVSVYFEKKEMNKILTESARVLKNNGTLLLNEPLEYVRWFKLYLRLLHLNILEQYFVKLYNWLAKARGLDQNTETQNMPKLIIRNAEEYAEILNANRFSDIIIRPSFVNLAPQKIEKYFFYLSYALAPFLTKLNKNVNNGLLIKTKISK